MKNELTWSVLAASLIFFSNNLLWGQQPSVLKPQASQTSAPSPSSEYREALGKMHIEAETYYRRLISASTEYELSSILADLYIGKVPTALVGILLKNLKVSDNCDWNSQTSQLDGQDFSFVGGRCAWLLNRTLDLGISPISSNSTEEEIEAFSYKALNARDLLLDPVEIRKMERIDQESNKAKSDAALSSETSKLILGKLAFTEDPDVRLIVAKNRNTRVRDLRHMAKWDENESVRAAARENLKFARAISMKDVTLTTETLYFNLPARN